MADSVSQAPKKTEAWIEDHKKVVYGIAAVGGLVIGYLYYKNSAGASTAASALPSPGTAGTPTNSTIPTSPEQVIVKIETLKHTTTGGTGPNFNRGRIFGKIDVLTSRRNFLLGEEQHAISTGNKHWLARIQEQLRLNAGRLNPLRAKVGWGAVHPLGHPHPVNTVHKSTGGKARKPIQVKKGK